MKTLPTAEIQSALDPPAHFLLLNDHMDRTAVSRTAPNKMGKYEIKKLLGKGNMGVVFLAHDPVLERDVAIKVMAGSTIHDQEMKERFEHEAKAVARLHHPNIVTIHDLGYDHTGAPFIAMELLEGSDLEHLVEANELTILQRLEVVAQVCRGLHHAHSSGVVHRDVKPANIFVTRDGAKIMDFGVARWMRASLTQSGAVLGTASYMSPEQIRGERVDGRSDVFSVGLVLYQLLTNKKLYEGDNIETIFFKTLSQDPPNLVLESGHELPELEEILHAALATEIDDRYPSAEAMATAIETFLRKYSELLPERPVFRPRDGRDHGSVGGKGSLRTLSPANGEPTVPRRQSATLAPVPAATKSNAPMRGTQSGRDHGTSVRTRHVPLKPRPPAPSRLPRVAAALVGTAVLAGATYFFAFPRTEPPPVRETEVHDTAPPADLEQRFQFAEELLDRGQIAQAFEAVQNILTIDPGNARALELQDAIRNAADEQANADIPKTPTTTTSAPGVSASARERAAELAVDAALALNKGRLEDAASLIDEGQRLDPGSARWSELQKQLMTTRAEAELQATAAEHVRRGKRLLETGDYQSAIDAYRSAIEYAPGSREAQEGLERAISAKAESEAQVAASTRRFVESETTFTPSQTASEEVVGFQMEERFEVNETAEAHFPARIIIELNPTDAKPGEPYLLRVRVFNEGYRPLNVESLELASRFGGKTMGAGAPIPPRTRQIAPQATALVHEIGGTWKEEHKQGSITATLTLTDGGKFSKSLSWEP